MDGAHGTAPPGDRLSRFSQASLRINESLGFDPADVERLWQASQGEAFFDVRTGRRRHSARQVIRVLV